MLTNLPDMIPSSTGLKVFTSNCWLVYQFNNLEANTLPHPPMWFYHNHSYHKSKNMVIKRKSYGYHIFIKQHANGVRIIRRDDMSGYTVGLECYGIIDAGVGMFYCMWPDKRRIYVYLSRPEMFPGGFVISPSKVNLFFQCQVVVELAGCV